MMAWPCPDIVKPTWPWVNTSEHPNPTTKIGSKMGAEFTENPKNAIPRQFSHIHLPPSVPSLDYPKVD